MPRRVRARLASRRLAPALRAAMSPIAKRARRIPRSLVDAADALAAPSPAALRDRNEDDGRRAIQNSEKTAEALAPVGDALPRAVTLEDLTYDGEIIVASTASELDDAFDRLEALTGDEPTCGFDMEWKVTWKKGAGEAKTSLVQIAAASADLTRALVVLARVHTTGVTPRLKRWLRDAAIGKTGFNVRGDARKFERDYGVVAARVVELGMMARERVGACPGANTWSLARVCEHVLKKNLPKDKTRMSNWERDALNPDQIKYAAMDAWASLLAYRALKSIALLDSVHGAGYECEPLPEPVVSSEDEDEESEDDEAGEERNEEKAEDVASDDDDDDEEDARGEITMQSTRVAMIDLTTEESLVYDKHVAGQTLSAIAEDNAMDFQDTMDTLVMAIRKGCSFYFKLLEIPPHLTSYFYEHVSAHGTPPKLVNFTERAAEMSAARAKSSAIALALKLARERE
jgi:hypothetical protein